MGSTPVLSQPGGLEGRIGTMGAGRRRLFRLARAFSGGGDVMLTRLRVRGFKNLLDLDVRFGPFTCLAGANGVGKSNLFDAIRFLHLLSKNPIMEAVRNVRDSGGRSAEPGELFTAFGTFRA